MPNKDEIVFLLYFNSTWSRWRFTSSLFSVKEKKAQKSSFLQQRSSL